MWAAAAAWQQPCSKIMICRFQIVPSLNNNNQTRERLAKQKPKKKVKMRDEHSWRLFFLFVPFTFIFFFPSWRFKMTVGARLFFSGIVDSCVDHFFLLVVLSSSSFFSDVLPSSRPWFIAPFENRECEGRKPLVRRSTVRRRRRPSRAYITITGLCFFYCIVFILWSVRRIGGWMMELSSHLLSRCWSWPRYLFSLAVFLRTISFCQSTPDNLNTCLWWTSGWFLTGCKKINHLQPTGSHLKLTLENWEWIGLLFPRLHQQTR